MIHFQGAVFWVSSSMQLIIKLLRPGRIIPAFFFFLPRIRVKLYFEGGSSSMHLLAGFVLRGLESEKGPIWAGQNRLLESKPHLRAHESGKFQDFPPTWSTAGREQSRQAVLLEQVHSTQSTERREMWNDSRAFLYCHLKLYQDIFYG